MRPSAKFKFIIQVLILATIANAHEVKSHNMTSDGCLKTFFLKYDGNSSGEYISRESLIKLAESLYDANKHHGTKHDHKHDPNSTRNEYAQVNNAIVHAVSTAF
jgi:hypothetical protein